jgi:hypothetical protein
VDVPAVKKKRGVGITIDGLKLKILQLDEAFLRQQPNDLPQMCTSLIGCVARKDWI